MNRKLWIGWAGSAAFGGLCAAASIFWGPPGGWGSPLIAAVGRFYELVGVTLIGLAPLAVWTIYLFVKHVRKGWASTLTELHYGFSARNSVLLGLLGTVVSLASAARPLAEAGTQGSSAAILKISTLVSQAVWSTIVGIVIALVADVGLHMIERHRLLNQARTNHDSEHQHQ